MANTTSPLLPPTEALLQHFGERLRLARLRRRLQAKQVAERAGMTAVTLRRVERGMPGVTIGAYLAVMQVLQLQADVAKLAAEDPLGRQLQDSEAQGGMRPRRARRAPKVHPGAVTAPSVPLLSVSLTDQRKLPPVTAVPEHENSMAKKASVSSADLLSALKRPLKPSPGKA